MSGCTRYALEGKDPALLKPVIFKENAANQVAAIIAEEKNPDLKLRLSVKAGGCSGLEYQFDLDEKVRPNDQVTFTNNVALLVDETSFGYLSGAEIDYVEDLEGERFTITNPNAASACGCGKSFDVPDR